MKIFCGLIGTADAIARARDLLAEEFGEVDCESPTVDFTFTDYYRAEMGEGLKRTWVGFRQRRARGYLALAKHAAVQIEASLAWHGRRTVNIDPGYIDDAQVVLATAKNYSHRLYMGMGYYAEVTLIYEHKGFKFLEWTYPDYRSETALRFFAEARDAYLGAVRERG
ncbi:MAG: DUF4416 family protein [bacterium]